MLHVLGRGNCFDDVAKSSLMNRQTAEKNFHVFRKHVSADLWKSWVHRFPVGEELKDVESRYSQLGYPGAVGSSDCTHVACGRCSLSEARTAGAGKEAGHTELEDEAAVDATATPCPDRLHETIPGNSKRPDYFCSEKGESAPMTKKQPREGEHEPCTAAERVYRRKRAVEAMEETNIRMEGVLENLKRVVDRKEAKVNAAKRTREIKDLKGMPAGDTVKS